MVVTWWIVAFCVQCKLLYPETTTRVPELFPGDQIRMVIMDIGISALSVPLKVLLCAPLKPFMHLCLK